MNLTRIAPSGSFIGQYMNAAASTETSLAYDFWCAMWTLGSACGRSVFVPRPQAPVFMNWYILLVAESGVTRKSTAVRLARDNVSDIIGVDHMVEGRSTPEYLFDRLTDTPHLAVAVSELVTFLGRESYIIELPALLTDLYDCPPERRGGSISRGERVIRDAYVTFLSASTPSWLRNSVNPTVIEGGFTSRCMFIHDERPKKKIAWPDERGSDITHVTELLEATALRAQEVQRIELLPAAMKRFESWYRQRDTTSLVPFIASFNSREDAHVLRAAACLAINDGTLAIDRGHINNAIKLIAQVKAGAIAMFADTGSSIKVAQGVDKAITLLIEAGPIGLPHTRLYSAVRYFMHRDEFHILIDTLVELGMVTKQIENRSGGGRKAARYVRTDAIKSHARLRQVQETFI